MSKNTNKTVVKEAKPEVVNVDKAIEKNKTSGTNLQAYIRSLIREAGE